MSIKPTFWLIALFLGWPVPARVSGFEVWYMVGWVLVVLGSVLFHELGHALTARRFGAEVSITLHLMGGLTAWSTERPISPGRRVLVAAAGSMVGFVLAGVVYGLFRFTPLSIPTEPWATLIGRFVFVSVFWGVINWLPVRALDGGHMVLGLLQSVLRGRAERVADVIFPLTTVALGIYAYRNGYVIGAVFCGFLLMDEINNWTRRSAPPPGTGLPPALG